MAEQIFFPKYIYHGPGTNKALVKLPLMTKQVVIEVTAITHQVPHSQLQTTQTFHWVVKVPLTTLPVIKQVSIKCHLNKLGNMMSQRIIKGQMNYYSILVFEIHVIDYC